MHLRCSPLPAPSPWTLRNKPLVDRTTDLASLRWQSGPRFDVPPAAPPRPVLRAPTLWFRRTSARLARVIKCGDYIRVAGLAALSPFVKCDPFPVNRRASGTRPRPRGHAPGRHQPATRRNKEEIPLLFHFSPFSTQAVCTVHVRRVYDPALPFLRFISAAF